ncbi:MAG: DNA alkylation repair protein [Candidatus Micrarchaeota archaeon]
MLPAVSELQALKDSKKAKILSGFFKTGKGEYGEGDVFLGVKVPEIRKIAKKHSEIPLSDVRQMLSSEIHEVRLAALLILVSKFENAESLPRKKIFDFYMENSEKVNNWDLVDSSAEKIAGAYLADKDRSVLYTLARSQNVWERRIAIIATYHFIKKGDFSDTLKISEMLLDDRHDLIHKAVGWMLREVGKRGGLAEEEAFLKKHAKKMPRTMLRYAIEKFGEKKRKSYMAIS